VIVGIIRRKPVLTHASIVLRRHAGVGEFGESSINVHKTER